MEGADYGDGKKKHLGRFRTAEETARGYFSAAKELIGECAWLNSTDQGR